MTILKFPNPMLITATYEITVFGEELKVLLDAMYESMKAKNGLGLAANQVGLLHRMFVMEGPEGRINLVNPVIVWRSISAANLREGCLSAPGDFVIVPSRSREIHVKFQDEKGESHVKSLTGLHAVCVQHEIDHLNGQIFFANKSIPKSKRQPLMKKWGIK
jgi:peptide deformylase